MIEVPVKERFGERIQRRFSNLAQRLVTAPYYFAHHLFKTGPAKSGCNAQVLAITADLRLYSSITTAAGALGWNAEWARSMKRGLQRCQSGRIPIVIYDGRLPGADWRRAIGQLSAAASQARILMATDEIDDDIWQIVLRRRGYDVFVRSADPEHVRRELRFAWLSLQEPAPCTEKVAGIPALSGR
jgi:hypothetical protein